MRTAIVFLDVDGVLNHSRLYSACAKRAGQTVPADWIDRQCVARVDALCDCAHAALVISSSWPSYLGAERFEAGMRECGLRTPIVGTCSGTVPEGTEPSESQARWDLIRRWLQAHPYVTTWVILDDCDWAGFPPNRFVQTNSAVGLTDLDVAQALGALTLPCSEELG